MAPHKCSCGGATYVDHWVNYRKDFQTEVFVRCEDCGRIGPVSADTETAVKLWNEFFGGITEQA